MPRIENDTFYRAAIERHGLSPRGVHWNSEHSQYVRFKVIASLLPRDLSDTSLVDAGCGFGDLFCFLKQERKLPKTYLGLDCMVTMVHEARVRTGQPVRHCDILHDPLEPADFYVCSGAMNILHPFETHLFITRCYEHAYWGFIFNLLEGKDESMVYNYCSIGTIKALGKALGARVIIKRGYLPRDFTVAFFKKDV